MTIFIMAHGFNITSGLGSLRAAWSGITVVATEKGVELAFSL